MQEVYRIVVTPYSYDYWDIFTTDKEVFDKLCHCYCDDEAREAFGEEDWDILCDSPSPCFPYIILGETQLRQPG